MGRRIRARHFFAYDTYELDIKGLSATLKGKLPKAEINLGLGSLHIKPEQQDVIDSLKQLDLLQFTLSYNVNAIADTNIRDQKLQEIIDAQIKMFTLTAEYLREGDVKSNALTQAEQDWDNYRTKLMNQTKAVLPWFRDEPGITIDHMFLDDQQLCWEKSGPPVGSTSQFRDSISLQNANCLDKLMQVSDELVRGDTRRCVCVSAKSGHGLTTLAKMYCGKLAKSNFNVLYISMKDAVWVQGKTIQNLVADFLIGPDFHQSPVEDIRTTFLVFDDINCMEPMARNDFLTILRRHLDSEKYKLNVALLFLNEYMLSSAKEVFETMIQNYELMDYDEKHGAKELREKWCARYTEHAKTKPDVVAILNVLKDNEKVFQRMIHPTVCALVFRFFATDPASLPEIRNDKTSTELFQKMAFAAFQEEEFDYEYAKTLESNILPKMAYDAWQLGEPPSFKNIQKKKQLQRMCFFAKEASDQYRFYDCFLDYFCARHIYNQLTSFNIEDMFDNFRAKHVSEDMLDFLRGFILQSKHNEVCQKAQEMLADQLTNRLKVDGWTWNDKIASTAVMNLRTANADTLLLASLSSLGEKNNMPAEVKISERESANRWIRVCSHY